MAVGLWRSQAWGEELLADPNCRNGLEAKATGRVSEGQPGGSPTSETLPSLKRACGGALSLVRNLAHKSSYSSKCHLLRLF